MGFRWSLKRNREELKGAGQQLATEKRKWRVREYGKKRSGAQQ
jgi:hypothetical protein